MNNSKTINERGNVASNEGILKVLSSGDKLMQDVEMWLLNDVKNRNHWTYLNLEQHLPLFAGIPILVAYVDGELGNRSGHNFTEVRKPNGDVVASFLDADAEHIVGYIPSKDDVRIEQKDGKTWIVANGKIWTWYAQELVSFLKEQGLDGQQISIETLVNEVVKDTDGDDMFPKWTPLGVTVLGVGVQEAVEDAYIRALSALGIDKIRETTKLKVASVYEQGQKQIPSTKTVKENRPTMTLKNLEGKFVGFKVLAVDGDRVALLSDKGETFISTATRDTTTGEIVEGVKTAVNGVVTLGDGDEKITFALDTVWEKANANVADLTAQLEKRNSEYETVSTALKTLQTQVVAQRKDAVKKAIHACLAEINEYGNAVLTENDCGDLLADDKLAEFAEMVDAKGNFIGDVRAKEIVSARCGEKTLEANKAKANSAKRTFAWQIDQNDNSQIVKDDVQSLIKKFTNK